TKMIKASDILKIMLYVSNFIMLICSLTLLVMFALMMVNGKQYVDLTGQYSSLYMFITVILLSLTMLGASIFGCCGMANQNIRCLTVYLGVVSLMIVVLVTCGIVGWWKKDEAFGEIGRELKESLQDYEPGSTNEETKAWDDIQEYLHCCGINSTKDWNMVESYRDARTLKYPHSCKDPNGTGAYVDGCLLKISMWFRENLWNIGFVISGFVIFMLMSVCLVCMMIASVHSSTKYDVERTHLTRN
ncbi:unnamed protein product, partial [Meganyctiphanes norvegica]